MDGGWEVTSKHAAMEFRRRDTVQDCAAGTQPLKHVFLIPPIEAQTDLGSPRTGFSTRGHLRTVDSSGSALALALPITGCRSSSSHG